MKMMKRIRQVPREEIYGKKIIDWYFDADYITLEFDDNTFCFLGYDIVYEEKGEGWYDVPIEHMIDENGYIKDEYAPKYFKLNSDGDELEADGMLFGPNECGIVKCNLDTWKAVSENYKKTQKIKQKQSFIELAKEFGIELTEEQSEKLYKQINGEK